MIEQLREMGRSYSRKKPSRIQGMVHLLIGNTECIVKLSGDDVVVQRSGKEVRADVELEMSEDTFEKLLSGEWNGMTAAARSEWSEGAPLEVRPPEDEDLDEPTLNLLYHFLTHFFSTGYPTVTSLSSENAREVHGGLAVPIAYGEGIRSAYYKIDEGDQINEDEEDPWFQVFVDIGGTGTAVIDGVEVALEEGTAVHVPPNAKHIVKPGDGDGLELLWIAYGEDA